MRGRWVAMAGDSVVRYVFAAVLRALAPGPGGAPPVVVGHRDFEYVFPCGTRASFFWRPYAANVSDLLSEFAAGAAERGAAGRQDLLLLGTGLWHVLHDGDPRRYGRGVAALAGAALRYQHDLERMRVATLAPPTWLTVTATVPGRLRTAQKARQMTAERIEAYNAAATRALAARREAGLDLAVLDMYRVTRASGVSEDGIHYNNQTYDLALNAWLLAVALGGAGAEAGAPPPPGEDGCAGDGRWEVAGTKVYGERRVESAEALKETST